MSDHAHLFPGFASHWIDAPAGKIFARVRGEGPPVVLLHGFGETHVAWRKIAPSLARRFTVVAMDLRGYGWSSVPTSERGANYTKREMAADVVAVMESLGHVRFALVGHDRGARVGQRLALDQPGRLDKIALVNIAPLDDDFGDGDLQRVGRARFLAADAPKPEDLIGLDPIGFLDDALINATKAKSLDVFEADALAAYRQAFNDPARIRAFCEDFRAGATIDRAHLEADRAEGKKLAMPTLIIAGDATFPKTGPSLIAAWREWRDDAIEARLDCGLFPMEEAPEATLAALEKFL
ncbi:MAG: alpha/beta hydrolase [Alphaproteobacteria bacterium]|nr:alpha/beta hydrolase [Alphaproteobacteria bacterium]MBM3651361.1 alpha/beta hydrolase [Alphaproteobacteria bacterium]